MSEKKTLTLTVKAELVRTKSGGKLYMAVSDCIANVSDGETDKSLGSVGGVFGAGYELVVGDNAWYVAPEEFWRAVNEAIDRDEAHGG